ncbi:MAG: hypothetical protein R2873_03785 [Caldilineaceae bacterium]
MLEPAQSLRLIAPQDSSDDAFLALLPEADAIVTQCRPMTAEIMAAAPKLKLIQRYGSRPTMWTSARPRLTQHQGRHDAAERLHCRSRVGNYVDHVPE